MFASSRAVQRQQHLWGEAVPHIKRNSLRNAECLAACLIFKAAPSDMYQGIEISITTVILF